MKPKLLLLALFCVAINCFANSYIDNQYSNDINLTFEKLDGNTCQLCWVDNTYKGSDLLSLKIPGSLRDSGVDYTVVKIGDMAFSGYDVYESIELPELIKSIGNGAFMNLTKLKSVNFPSSLTEIQNSSLCNAGIESVNLPNNIGTFASVPKIAN